MDIRFNCPRCNQHLSVDESGAGMTVNCPSCNDSLEIPRSEPPPPPPVPPKPTPRPPPVSSFPQPGASQKKSTHPLLGWFGCMVTLGTIVALAVVAFVLWLAYDSSKPKLLAKVGVTANVLRVTNGNDTAWDSTTIILNDGFVGPILVINGSWAPNETRDLALSDFQGRFNHQPFKPGYDGVRQVMIQARGLQLETYETRSSKRLR